MTEIYWQKLPTKYGGECIVCGNSIPVGEDVEWKKEIGIRHIECGEKVDHLVVLPYLFFKKCAP